MKHRAAVHRDGHLLALGLACLRAQSTADGVEVSVRLRTIDAWFQSPDQVKAHSVEPSCLIERGTKQRVSRERNPEIGCERRENAGEGFRRDANDGEGLAV